MSAYFVIYRDVLLAWKRDRIVGADFEDFDDAYGMDSSGCVGAVEKRVARRELGVEASGGVAVVGFILFIRMRIVFLVLKPGRGWT